MQRLSKNLGRKIGSVIVTVLLIGLILFVLVPPATSVNLTTGYPFSNNEIIFGNTITFQDVNLTIRGDEKIPVTLLNFSIYNESDVLIDSVEFDVNGNEQTDLNSVFEVTLDSTIQPSWNNYGYGYGYDEPEGPGYYFGYGYGYGNGTTDITFLYDIEYTIRQSGTFYAKFYVNSTPTNSSFESHIFDSAKSADFAIENYTFYEGWNLITMPAQNTINASHLASNITGCEMVSWFDAENQTYKTHINGSAAYDFELEDGYGLFVYVNQNASVKISGASITTVNVSLNKAGEGYNMIGWFNNTDSDSDSIQTNISGCGDVSWFDAENQTFKTDTYGLPTYDFNITRGTGIFVKVNESSFWLGEG